MHISLMCYNHRQNIVDKFTWLSGIIVFFYELSGFGLESSCSHFSFRFRICFEQGVTWHSDNYRVWIHSETRTWHDKNIHSSRTLVSLECFTVDFSQFFSTTVEIWLLGTRLGFCHQFIAFQGFSQSFLIS